MTAEMRKNKRRRNVVCLIFIFSVAYCSLSSSPGKEVQDNETILGESVTPFEDSEKCYIILSGFRRPSTMTALAIHYARMNIFTKVILSWGAVDENVPRVLMQGLKRHKVKDKVMIRREKTDDLNNRFVPSSDLMHIDCVFIADDDILIPETGVLLTYNAWKDHRSQIVGAFPRGHKDVGERIQYIPDPETEYSIILTKFFATSATHLLSYGSGKMTKVRNYVRQKMNCEDIAFNMMVSKLTKLPPVYVHIPGKLDLGADAGLYTRPSHAEARHECLRWMSEEFGESLISTNIQYAHFTKDVFIHSKSGSDKLIGSILSHDKEEDSTLLRSSIFETISIDKL